MKIYKSYMFRNKDPIIDKLRTIVKDSMISYVELSANSGVSTGTLHNWFYGETRRPQFASTMAVARALGYDLELVRVDDKKLLKLIKGGRG